MSSHSPSITEESTVISHNLNPVTNLSIISANFRRSTTSDKPSTDLTPATTAPLTDVPREYFVAPSASITAVPCTAARQGNQLNNTKIRKNDIETSTSSIKELSKDQHRNQVQPNTYQVANHQQHEKQQKRTTVSILPGKIATASNADTRVLTASTAKENAPVLISQPSWLVAKTRATTNQNPSQAVSAPKSSAKIQPTSTAKTAIRSATKRPTSAAVPATTAAFAVKTMSAPTASAIKIPTRPPPGPTLATSRTQ